MITYRNAFGSLSVVVATDYMPVLEITHKSVTDAWCFPIEIAEQIALISENRHLQIAPYGDNLRKFYAVHYVDTRRAAVCRIARISWQAQCDARAALAKPQSCDI